MQPEQTEHICPGTYGLTHPGRGCWGQDVCGALLNPTCLQNNSRHCLSLGCSPLCIPSSRVGVGRRKLGASAKGGPREQVSRTGPKQTGTFPAEPGRHVGGESLLLTPRHPSRLCAPDQVQRARGSSGLFSSWTSPASPIQSGYGAPALSALKRLQASPSAPSLHVWRPHGPGRLPQGSLGSDQLCGQAPDPQPSRKAE